MSTFECRQEEIASEEVCLGIKFLFLKYRVRKNTRSQRPKTTYEYFPIYSIKDVYVSQLNFPIKGCKVSPGQQSSKKAFQMPSIQNSPIIIPSDMKKASNYAFLQKKPKVSSGEEVNHNALFGVQAPGSLQRQMMMAPGPKHEDADLNVFVLSFDGTKEAEKNLAGGDPYECKKCSAILNKFSLVVPGSQVEAKYELKPNESLWICEFCGYPNALLIEKQEIPVKEDMVYMLESALEQGESKQDSTVIFCIDISGSMNTTSTIEGKMNLKFGVSQEEIQMLRQFMEPGDEQQLNFLPGAQNQNKTFVSRKQCVLSAIESQLNQIKKNDPNKRVGFVLFSNEVTIVGDGHAESVHIVGDRLQKVQDIVGALAAFKLTAPLSDTYEPLIKELNKAEAKGQTALGPALVAAIQVASKGSKGSTVVLCTDGLANIGVGNLEAAKEAEEQFYLEVAAEAKDKNVAVSVITIKGESSKLEILGKVVEATNGNVKVVNPEKLSDDFANILKDEVIGLNVCSRIMLHKALVFRNEDGANLKDNKTILVKQFANATVNTRISFEYELRDQQDLKFMEIEIEQLKKVPFQAQITYESPKGGKFLRVISSESKTTMERKEMEKEANIGVVHQRVTSQTAQLSSKGGYIQSESYNNKWSNYLNDNFQAPEYAQKQQTFNNRNRRLKEAISNKQQKQSLKMAPPQAKKMEAEEVIMEVEEEEKPQQKQGFLASIFGGSKPKAAKAAPQKSAMKEEARAQKKAVERKASVDSDEDEMQMQNYMMEKNDLFD